MTSALHLESTLQNLTELCCCAQDSQPGSALLQKFTSFQFPLSTYTFVPQKTSYPHQVLKVLQKEHCKRFANILKADLSVRLNSRPSQQYQGRGNSIGHAWVLDEAGCPSNVLPRRVSCHVGPHMLAAP